MEVLPEEARRLCWTGPGRRARRLAALVALLLPLLVHPALAEETGGGGNNVVVVFNEADGLERTGSGVVVSITASDPAENENLALARSSCTDCRTVAVAMQTVPITRDASVIRPTNLAIAVNVDCQSCQTFAAAYQYVLTTGGPVRLSVEGHRAVSEIRSEARALAASGLPFPELEARLDELAERFRAVIDAELRRVGREGSLAKHVDSATGTSQ